MGPVSARKLMNPDRHNPHPPVLNDKNGGLSGESGLRQITFISSRDAFVSG
jgi:hypothetical protein